jgi:aldehyde:ferredoxin oxidoreductase
VGLAIPAESGKMRAFPDVLSFGSLAQSVEQLAFNQLVIGSNPIRPTIFKNARLCGLFLCPINCPQQFDGSFGGEGYQDISGWVLTSSVNVRYQFSKHTGAIFGVANFDSDITIEDESERTDVKYCYEGVFLGLVMVF